MSKLADAVGAKPRSRTTKRQKAETTELATVQVGASTLTTQGNSSADGHHNLDRQRFLQGYGGVSPANPPTLKTIQLVQVPDEPVMYTPEQAAAIAQETKVIKRNTQATVKAYSYMEEQLKCEAVIHDAHRRLLRTAAKSEFAKVRSDVALGRDLHKLRVAYGVQSELLDAEDQFSTDALGQKRQQIAEQLQLRKLRLREQMEAAKG